MYYSFVVLPRCRAWMSLDIHILLNHLCMGPNPGPASDNFITCCHIYHGVCKTVGFTVLRCLPPTAIIGSCSAAWVFGQVRRDKQGLWKTKLRMQVAKTIKEGKHVPKPEMKLWKSKVVQHLMEGRCGAFAAIKGFFSCTRRVVVGSNFWQVCRQHQTIATCRISPAPVRWCRTSSVGATVVFLL